MMASNSRVMCIIFLILFVAFFSPFAYGKVIYVDDDAVGLNDGSSWTDAYNYLQDAITVATGGDRILVAQGVYKPDQGITVTPGDRRASFQLKNGVAVKGGYAGLGETDPNAHDIEAFETILSGDLSGNDIDVNDPGYLCHLLDRMDNSYHVITGSNTDVSTIIDGFTITGGYVSVIPLKGGFIGGTGMLVSSGSPTLINCTFTDNLTTNSGEDY